MKKYNISAEETVKFLYRGKINRIKEKDIYSFSKNPTETEITYFKEFFISKNKYKISWNDIENTEKRLGITLPDTLREYYHECGDLDINNCFSEILNLEEIGFSYTWLREDLESDEFSDDEIETNLKKTDNFLIFWTENQGVWNAGVKKEDLCLENPPVYMTTNDDLYCWEKVTNDTDTFIIFQVVENIPSSNFYMKEIKKEDLKEILLDEKISLEEISKSNFLSADKNIKISNYADYDNDKIYFFISKNNEIINSYVVKPKEKKSDYSINENIDNNLFTELGNIISKGDNGVISQLKEAFSNIKKYTLENNILLFDNDDIESSSVEEIRFIKFYRLSLILEKNGYLYFLDWKCELDDFKILENLLEKISDNKKYSLEDINFDEDEDIITWSKNFNENFKNKNILLAGFDLNSDSYAVFLISYEDFNEIKKLLKSINLRVDFAENF